MLTLSNCWSSPFIAGQTTNTQVQSSVMFPQDNNYISMVNTGG